MLSFDEDAKMGPLGALGVQPNAGFVPASVGGLAQEDRFAAGNAFRRISVDDKQIINSKADVNQLVPFKYK